jgi:hypothetical protein
MAAALVLLAALALPPAAPAEAADRSAGTKGSGAAPAAVPAPPARYSVDLVMTGEGQSVTIREFHHDGMVRRVMVAEGETITFNERPDRKVSYTIMASQGMYVEMPLAEPPPGAAAGSDMKVKPMGTGVIKGRVCDKSGIVSGGRVAYLWVSRDTGLPVRVQDDTMLAEWTNCKAGAQHAGLFGPPSGYQEFQMPGMAGGSMWGKCGAPAGTRPPEAPAVHACSLRGLLAHLPRSQARAPGDISCLWRRLRSLLEGVSPPSRRRARSSNLRGAMGKDWRACEDSNLGPAA